MHTPLSLAALYLFAGSALAMEIPIDQCPAPVQATVRNHSRDGKLDEIESFAIEGKTLYVAEIDLPGKRDLKIHIASDGTLLKIREDIAMADIPQPVRATAEAKLAGGTVDDVEMETANGKVTYHVEIERKGAPDIDLVIAPDGKLLSETEDPDD